jgi:hypothetical protein
MSNLLKLLILLSGLSFTGIVLYLLVRKKINEKNTLVWLTSSTLILILSLSPSLLDHFAKFVGVDYPPSLLFLVAVMVLFLLVLYHSMQISVLHDKIKELSQYIALRDVEDHTVKAKKYED